LDPTFKGSNPFTFSRGFPTFSKGFAFVLWKTFGEVLENLWKSSRKVSHIPMNGIEGRKVGVYCQLHVSTFQHESNPKQARLRHGLPLAPAWMAASGLTRLDITPELSCVGQNRMQTSCGASKEQIQFNDSYFSSLLTYVQ